MIRSPIVIRRTRLGRTKPPLAGAWTNRRTAAKRNHVTLLVAAGAGVVLLLLDVSLQRLLITRLGQHIVERLLVGRRVRQELVGCERLGREREVRHGRGIAVGWKRAFPEFAGLCPLTPLGPGDISEGDTDKGSPLGMVGTEPGTVPCCTWLGDT